MIEPRRFLRWTWATVASVAAVFVLTLASGAAVSYHRAGEARLRLSWSARPERIESCRAVSREQLEREEEHMRQRVECEGRFATYALRVEADGRRVIESVVRGAGLRHDRPVYLLRDFAIPSGVRHVRVVFARRERKGDEAALATPAPGAESDTGLFAGRAEREAVERARRRRAAIPATLVLDTVMTFAPGRVIVITFDAERRALEVLDQPRQPR
ncbi:MAG TPA: hypothetical protein VFW03_15650 [Gemmatimonadaceae bacterium]|nr:hypothetical protein [Gemmatimonadaceae bacterium]